MASSVGAPGDAAVLHRDDPIGVGGRVADLVQHHDDRPVLAAGHVAQAAHQRSGVGHVQVVEWLVEQQVPAQRCG
ncbi:hypothetical protein [Roseitranquillus sediminis]|uniref:hypothetical protein n=1 Tax=Roseitranquillus sediminis TaxID=2809051 RepID=UPI0038737275